MAIEPVGLSQDLAAQRVMRAQIGGQDLAIWRGASLSVQAWGNRCPHRGMRLSHGFVRGDSLACAYHGWHYNCQATCHYIPAHPELDPPATIKPQVFSVNEQQGVLWVSLNGDGTPFTLPGDCLGLRSITFDCGIDAAITAYKKTPLENDRQNELKVVELSTQPNILSFGQDSVLVLFQQSETVTTIAHVLVKIDCSISEKIRISRWCETVRRVAENKDEN